jgi:RimJ/RimL family protein N-acetyltransferase
VTAPVELTTARLTLRQWCAEDYVPFAKLNADPRVMEYFPSALDRTASDALANRLRDAIAERGWGLWATELRESRTFVGFVGLQPVPPGLPFAGIEIGWRLAQEYWGKGLAPEAARKALQFAFSVLKLDEVLSFTTIGNRKSRTVMEKLGMHDTGRNFDHPNVQIGNALRAHCLYRLTKTDWSTP